ncbi:MAG: tetratricopeptide repeat protein [Planctomycetes bacterium]|nr:tetratricopeptide repeat protein [Planctomycetota bacterium]
MIPRRAPGPRALAVLAALAALLPYLDALGNEFLTWDDNIVILGQPFLREATLENLWRILSPVPAREEWLPVRDLTLLANFVLSGDDPFWFSAVNVALHAATSAALVLLFLRLGAAPAAALLGALVFAVHAAHVESVTWLSGRKDPLSALFLVLALLAHIRWRAREGRYGVTLALLVLALGSKASSFVFPLWALAYDLAYRRGLSLKARLLPLAPYAALSLAMIATFLKLIAQDGVIEEYPEGGLPAVLLTNVVLWRDYALHVLLPWRHQAIYEVDFVRAPWSASFLSAAGLLGALAGLAWRHRSRPWAPFSLVLFYGSLVPYLNVVPHGIYYAERYLYLPSIAFALVAGLAGAAILDGARAVAGARGRAARLAAAGGLAAFLAVHGAVLASRNLAWASSETFWRHQAAALPRNPAPLMNLGETHEVGGDDGAAERTYRRVRERFGEVPEAVHRLARIARRQGRLEEARELYERAAALAPRDPRPRNNLAEVHLARGELDRAIAVWAGLAEEHPRYLLARANLARALEAAGRPAEAAGHWRLVISGAELLPQEPLVREARARLAGLEGPEGAVKASAPR